MSLEQFFNNTQQQIPQQNSAQKNQFSGNKNIDGFCQKFFENAGPNYTNTPMNFIKLAFCNIGMIMEMLKSPEIHQIEEVANTAVQKGWISKDTLNSFSNVVKLFNNQK